MTQDFYVTTEPESATTVSVQTQNFSAATQPEITAEVMSIGTQEFFVTSETQRTAEVTAVGIQGLAGGSTINLEDIPNVDAQNTKDGSVLVYKQATSKWTSTTTLDAQNMEGGEF
jgi:hypothetical protein